jgi:hypothetical protein
MAVGRDLPHDLAQYAVEAATHYRNGFWGLVARGATFKSTGRRVTKPRHSVIVAHRRDLMDSEAIAALHLRLWKQGAAGAVAGALDRALRQWQDLQLDETLVCRRQWGCRIGRRQEWPG